MGSATATTTQKYSLKWNDFTGNVASTFKELHDRNDFTDVTLALADGSTLETHRVILSSVSTYFRDVLRSVPFVPASNVVLILKETSREEAKAILEFAYTGEVNVGQDLLPALLKTAREFKIKGLDKVEPPAHVKIENDRRGSDSDCNCLEPTNPQEQQQQQQQPPPSYPVMPPAKRWKLSADNYSSPHDFEAIQRRRSSSPKPSTTTPSTTTSENLSDRRFSQQYSNGLKRHNRQMESNEADAALDFSRTSSALDYSPKPTTTTTTAQQQSQQQQQQQLQLATPDCSPDAQGRYNCSECGKYFKHPGSLQHHRHIHRGTHRCPTCGKAFSRRWDLDRHLKKSKYGCPAGRFQQYGKEDDEDEEEEEVSMSIDLNPPQQQQQPQQQQPPVNGGGVTPAQLKLLSAVTGASEAAAASTTQVG